MNNTNFLVNNKILIKIINNLVLTNIYDNLDIETGKKLLNEIFSIPENEMNDIITNRKILVYDNKRKKVILINKSQKYIDLGYLDININNWLLDNTNKFINESNNINYILQNEISQFYKENTTIEYIKYYDIVNVIINNSYDEILNSINNNDNIFKFKNIYEKGFKHLNTIIKLLNVIEWILNNNFKNTNNDNLFLNTIIGNINSLIRLNLNLENNINNLFKINDTNKIRIISNYVKNINILNIKFDIVI